MTLDPKQQAAAAWDAWWECVGSHRSVAPATAYAAGYEAGIAAATAAPAAEDVRQIADMLRVVPRDSRVATLAYAKGAAPWHLGRLCHDAADMLTRLSASEAAIREDAERYRFLAADGGRAKRLLTEYSGLDVEYEIDNWIRASKAGGKGGE